MNTVATIVTIEDGDILHRTLQAAARQFDWVVVSIGNNYWEGFYPDERISYGDDELEATSTYIETAKLNNVSIVTSNDKTQILQRNKALDIAEERNILQEGDIHVLLDADEVWKDEDIEAHLQYMDDNPDVQAMAVPTLDFYFRGTHVRSSGNWNDPNHLYCIKSRLHRYTKGARYRGNNDMEYANGKMYPNWRYNQDITLSWNVLGGYRPCYHYDYTRHPQRAKTKYQAFKHRHPGVRPNWYETVYLPCLDNPEAVNDTPHGIGLMNTPDYYNAAYRLPDVVHPPEMQGYMWI